MLPKQHFEYNSRHSFLFLLPPNASFSPSSCSTHCLTEKMVSGSTKKKIQAKPHTTPAKYRKNPTRKPPVKKNPKPRRRKQSLGWTDLPPDLLLAVSSRLILRFVCTSWSISLSAALPPVKPRSSPWLLFQLINSSKFVGIDVGTGISFSFGPYSQFEGKICIGSHNGWLILADHLLVISLFNPISESHVTLPPLPSFVNNTALPRNLSVIKKVVFSSYPGAADFVVVAVLNLVTSPMFVFAEGRSDWCTPYWGITLHDVFCLEGRKRLHVISRNAKLWELHLSDGDPVNIHVKDMCTGLHTKMPLYRDWPRKCTRIEAWNSCMVITKDLKAYEVSRRVKRDAVHQPAGADDISVDCWSDCLCESCKIKFQIVTSEDDPSIAVVKRKSPLKGYSFFVGSNQMIPFSKAMGFPGIRPNCVYLVDSCRYPASSPLGRCRYDLLVFDVSRETIEEYRPSSSLPTWPPPVWFVPMVPKVSKKKKKRGGKRKRDGETS